MDEKQYGPTGSSEPAGTVPCWTVPTSNQQPGPAPYPSAPMYPQNIAKDINAPPPTYSQATANQFQPG